MSNSGKNMRKLEQKFNTLRQKGNKEVSLQLSEAQATFVREELKLPIYAILYEIQTYPWQRFQRLGERWS